MNEEEPPWWAFGVIILILVVGFVMEYYNWYPGL